MKKSISAAALCMISLCVVLSFRGELYSLSAGTQVGSLTIRDADDRPAAIPDVGGKVLTIFYADPDASDVNDPLADALKARNFDKGKYRGIGIANLADTIKPNFVIRMVIRRKIEKYNSTILTDPDRTVSREWGLGDCNDVNVVIVIGKDGRVKFVQKVSTAGESRGLIDTVVGTVEREMEK